MESATRQEPTPVLGTSPAPIPFDLRESRTTKGLETGTALRRIEYLKRP